MSVRWVTRPVWPSGRSSWAKLCDFTTAQHNKFFTTQWVTETFWIHQRKHQHVAAHSISLFKPQLHSYDDLNTDFSFIMPSSLRTLHNDLIIVIFLMSRLQNCQNSYFFCCHLTMLSCSIVLLFSTSISFLLSCESGRNTKFVFVSRRWVEWYK